MLRYVTGKNIRCLALVGPVVEALGIEEAVERHAALQRNHALTNGQAVVALVLAQLYHAAGRSRRIPLVHMEEWAEKSGVAGYLGVPAEQFNQYRLGDALEAVHVHRVPMLTEVALQAMGQLGINPDRVHEDLTHLAFSGTFSDSELVRRGYHPKGADVKLCQMALCCVGQEAFPAWGEPLPGNTNGGEAFIPQFEATSHLLGQMEKSRAAGGQARNPRTWIADRAVATYENIAAVQRRGDYFIFPLPSNEAREKVVAALPESAYQPLAYQSQHDPRNRYSVAETKVTLNPSRGQRGLPLTVRALAILSERRLRDHRSGRAKQLRKVKGQLWTLQRNLNRRQLSKRKAVEERLRKILKRPFGEFFDVTLAGEDGQLSLTWKRNREALAQRRRIDGKFLLATNHDLPALDVFQMWKDQHRIEARNRNFKTDLEVYPIWLHKDERIDGLATVVLLGLMVYAALEILAQQRGVRMTGRRILERFGDCSLSEMPMGRGPPELVLSMDEEQWELLSMLGLPEPEESLGHLLDA